LQKDKDILERKLQMCTDEINKGNQIIEKLQNSGQKKQKKLSAQSELLA